MLPPNCLQKTNMRNFFIILAIFRKRKNPKSLRISQNIVVTALKIWHFHSNFSCRIRWCHWFWVWGWFGPFFMFLGLFWSFLVKKCKIDVWYQLTVEFLTDSDGAISFGFGADFGPIFAFFGPILMFFDKKSQNRCLVSINYRISH